MDWIIDLFEQYGYIVLVIGLFAESLALPFPGELAMAISGHMSSFGSLNTLLIICCSYFGAIAGTAVTYYLGYRLGTPFFSKYGRYFFLKKERIRKISKWFDRYGNKLILVSYFVPGLRHFTGYVSGILRVRIGSLLLYNFTGGLVLVLTYVMVGKIFGKDIEKLLHIISQYSLVVIIILGVVVWIGLHIKKNKQAVIED